MRGWVLALAMIASSTAAAAQPSKPVIKLPIAKGFWIDGASKCAAATYGYGFDGGRWGAIYFYGPKSNLGPAAELQPITQTRPVAGGFTNMQFGGYDGAGYFHVKSLAPNRMTLRTGAPGPEGIQVIDETLVRCDLATLSPKMQAGLKKSAPSVLVK